MTTYRIRPETAMEGAALRVLTETAFRPMRFSDDTEGAALDAMRRDGDLALSLVADQDGPVGHVALSPATVGGQTGWYGLGPISVHPDHRRRGVGSALMREAIAWARARAAKGVVLVGDPAYYSRFGFVGGLSWRDIEPAYVQHLSFGAEPQGAVVFAPALDAA
ncbi:MAG: N-acetyltransferase [Pseudomonadota bacterium]